MSDFIVVTHHVTITGDIDLANVSQLDAALGELHGDIDVDCRALDFIGSNGFHSFGHSHKSALTHGTKFLVWGMNAFQRRIGAIVEADYII